MHLKRNNTSVITIRGTSSAAEVLQDANFWTPVVVLQLAQVMGPSLFNIDGIMNLTTRARTRSRENQLENLYNYTRDLANNTDEVIYLTGHSLGGGLASAIGGMLNLSAVVFSAPGIQATSALLKPQPSLANVLHGEVNIVPNNDIVPKVDRQAGVVLPIECPFANPLRCHQLTHSVCEILASCGDGGGRGFPRHYNRSCKICRKSGQILPGCHEHNEVSVS